MLNKKNDILAALRLIDGVCGVFFYYPESFAALPCISYYEINNSPAKSADDNEYLSEQNFQIDIWCKTSAEASVLADKADKALIYEGFVREFSRDVYEEGAPAHKTMRFQYIGG